MATTDRPIPSDAEAAAAAELQTAEFVSLAGVATGDGLAATAQLARALSARSIPFQVRIAPLGASHEAGSEDACTVAIGRPTVEANVVLDRPGSLSAAAHDVASELSNPDPALALAGLTAAEAPDEGDGADIVEAAGLERRPGLGLPTSEPSDGLAWTTLLHAPFSGDPDAVEDHLATVDRGDEDADRRLASLVAMSVASDGGPPAAGAAVGTVLRPHVGGPLETIPGYADVLSALAVEAPGIGLQLALQGSGREGALERWRAHGRRVHEAVRSADRTADDDILVARLREDVPLHPVARLLRDFVAAPPVVAVAGDEAVVITTRDAPDRLSTAVEAARATVEDDDPGAVQRAATRGRYARVHTESPETFLTALAEAR